MTNRPGSDGFEQLEAQLRGAPPHEADAVRPDDRLGDIRAAVSPTRRRSGAWAPIAADCRRGRDRRGGLDRSGPQPRHRPSRRPRRPPHW